MHLLIAVSWQAWYLKIQAVGPIHRGLRQQVGRIFRVLIWRIRLQRRTFLQVYTVDILGNVVKKYNKQNKKSIGGI
jgi:hypothetical protein